MDTRKSEVVEGSAPLPECAEIANRTGLRDSRDLKLFLAAMMRDGVNNRITPAVTHAVSTVAHRLLRTAELEYKYGTMNGSDAPRAIDFTSNGAPVQIGVRDQALKKLSPEERAVLGV